MSVTVVSACYGGYDAPAVPPEQDMDVLWVMVTDGTVEVPAPWKAIYEPRTHLHPRMAAKVPKCLPWNYGQAGYYRTEAIVWLDASATINRSDFVSMCVDTLGGADVAMWPHPQRDDIIEEADVSLGMAKYQGQPVIEQASHYVAGGHPRHSGLWATGCMAWGRHNDNRASAGAWWLTTQTIWTYQDQISWPVAARRFDLDVRPLPGGLWDRTWLTFRPHASDL